MLKLQHESNPEKKVLFLVYSFVFLAILSDVPIIIFYTLTSSYKMTRFLLYGSEFIIMVLTVYMLVKPSRIKLPVFIYLYGAYVIAISAVSILFYDKYSVIRSSRGFLAIIPPVIFGYYFGYYFRDQREKYIKKLIMFLTIMSLIGFVEFFWWGISQNTLTRFYSSIFDIGSYYHYVRNSSLITDSGIMISGIRPTGLIIPWISKRLTGLYFEPFAAGFNSSLAVILILYCRMAGYKKYKWEYAILGINFAAVILTTSRSSYLFLSIFLFSYFLIKGKLHPGIVLCFLTLLYKPFREFCYESTLTLGGGVHQEAAMGLPEYIWSNIGKIEFIWGGGIGSMTNSLFFVESGYGAVFGQLGIIGLLIIILLYMKMTIYKESSLHDRFFAFGMLVATMILLFFAGYPFGYKTYGLLHLFLGTIMAQYKLEQYPVYMVQDKINPQFLSVIN